MNFFDLRRFLYAFKPNTFGKNNMDAEIACSMKAAKALVALHISLAHPSDGAHTLKLGEMGERCSMSVGYHRYEQELFDFWDTALTSKP